MILNSANTIQYWQLNSIITGSHVLPLIQTGFWNFCIFIYIYIYIYITSIIFLFLYNLCLLSDSNIFLFSGLNRHFQMLQKPKKHSEERRKVFKILQLPADLYLSSSVVGSRQTPQESQIWCSLRQNMNICCTADCGSGRGKKGIPWYFCKQLLCVQSQRPDENCLSAF